MSDKEMAEEYVHNHVHYEVVKRENGTEYAKEVSSVTIKQAYSAGLKASRPKWHDLRKNPKDLPKPNVQVLICLQFEKMTATYIAYYRPALCKWQAYNLHEAQRNCNEEDFIDADEVIAWCEIPKFEEVEELLDGK